MFKPGPICISCALYKNCNSPKVMTRWGNNHLKDKGLIYVICDSPSDQIDECGNPFDTDSFKVIKGFLDQLPCRWAVGFYARCYPGKDEKGKKIIPDRDQFTKCYQFFHDEIKDEKNVCVLALGRRVENLLLGEAELKRELHTVYHTPTGTPIVVTKSPYQPKKRMGHLIKDFNQGFLTCVMQLQGDYKSEKEERCPYRVIESWHDAMAALDTLPERVFYDIEHSFSSMYHPDSELLCLCVGWEGCEEILCFPGNVIDAEWVEKFARNRILEAYNVYTDTIALLIFYGVNVFDLCKGIGDTFFKFFLRDQSQHGNSLKARSMNHLGVHDWSVRVWQYIEAKTEALRAEAKAIRAENRKLKKAGQPELPICRTEGHFGDPPREVLYQYCAQDVWNHIRLELEIAPVCDTTVYNLCIQAVPALCLMAHRGLPIDTDYLRKYSSALDVQYEKIVTTLRKLKCIQQVEAGWKSPEHEFPAKEINPKSPIFMESLLTLLNHHTGVKTDSGRMKCDETTLKVLAGIYPPIPDDQKETKHNVVAALFRLRKIRDLKSKFIDKFINLSRDNRIHTTYRIGRTETAGATAGSDLSGGTDSGRLSSDNPNVQNIKKDPTFRNAINFNPFPDGFDGVEDPLMVEIDYSTMELVVLAWMANVAGMLDAINAGEDLHKVSATHIWGIPLGEVTKELRDKAKTGNFAKVYGETPNVFAARNNISLQEALDFFNNHNKAFPEIEDFFTSLKKRVLDGKPITTPFGRSRTFELTGNRRKDAHIFREAGNFPIQGTASDMTLLSLILIYQLQKKRPDLKKKFLPINIVHDAIWLAMSRKHIIESLTMLEKLMTTNEYLPFDFDAKRSVGFKVGRTAGTWKEFDTIAQIKEYLELVDGGMSEDAAYKIAKPK